MNNALAVTCIARRCLSPLPSQIALYGSRWPASALVQRCSPRRDRSRLGLFAPQPFQRRPLSYTNRNEFHASRPRRILKDYEFGGHPERGLKFQDKELSKGELRQIFGRQRPEATAANRLLRILHARRVDGTLDLPLPEDVQETLDSYPAAFDSGLDFLRRAFPLDEDAAVSDRIDREDAPQVKDNPSQLLQRGQDLGIYRGPQSGHFQAALSEKEGDVYGKSELDAIRAENEAAAAREEEEIERRFEAEKAKYIKNQKVKSLAAKPEQGLQASEREFRPPNEFEKWVLKAQSRATSTLTLESPEIVKKSTGARLLPSFVLVAALCLGCFYYAQAWSRPKQSERMFPNLSLSTATIGAIVGANFAVFFAWRFPPLWGLLNKYFMIVPAYPYALSMVGSIFSHQSLTHLLFNMAALYIFGPQLHEEVGRGNFVAIYMIAGLVGGYASFARSAVQRAFTTSSLGASGSVFGILAAFLWLRSDKHFTFFFVPAEYQKYVTFTGGSLIFPLIFLEMLGIFRIRKAGLDYFNHLVGIGVGLGAAEYLKSRRARRDSIPKSTFTQYVDRAIGRGKP